jgi:hypothetical protein
MLTLPRAIVVLMVWLFRLLVPLSVPVLFQSRYPALPLLNLNPTLPRVSQLLQPGTKPQSHLYLHRVLEQLVLQIVLEPDLRLLREPGWLMLMLFVNVRNSLLVRGYLVESVLS